MKPENNPKSNPGRYPDVADAARDFEAAFQKRLQDEGWERKIAAGVFEQERAAGRRQVWRWSTALGAAAGLFLTLGVFYGWDGGWMSPPDSTAPDAGWTALWALELEDQESLVFDGTVEEELTILAAFDD